MKHCLRCNCPSKTRIPFILALQSSVLVIRTASKHKFSKNVNKWVYIYLYCTLKKSKKDICFTMGPYRLSSCWKKKKLVNAASITAGYFLLSFTSSSLSLRLSRPLQIAVVFFSSHGGPVFAWTDIMSRLTLEEEMEYCKTCNRNDLFILIAELNNFPGKQFKKHISLG